MKQIKAIKLTKKQLVFLIVNVVLALAAIACMIAIGRLSQLLLTQKEAERWRGDNDMDFAQLSFYIPTDQGIGLPDVYAYRYAILDKFKEASLDADPNGNLFVDAWSTGGKVVASTSLGRGDASVTAVGGAFFDFHPLRLLSGNYLTESDLMKDRVLLDEDLAWLLFGGTELTGLELRLNNVPFVVAGVIEREQDFASRKAYTDGMGLYMSYDAYKLLEEKAGITCYELVMAEPVKNFSVNFAREKFPVKDSVIMENSRRFEPGRLLSLLLQFGTRSMQSRSISYPYWENAARYVEDWSTLLLLLCILFAFCPLVTVVAFAIRILRRGKEKMEDDLLPSWKDKAREAVRVRQRRRWLKQHGQQETE